MIYQLPNGKVLCISIEDYLAMSDDDLLLIIAYRHGEEVPSYNYHDKYSSLDETEEPSDDDIITTDDIELPHINISDVEGDLV